MAQVELVKGKLKALFPGVAFEHKVITTKGDDNRISPIYDIGAVGAFTREIEQELQSGKIDIAVHSLKDIPAVLPEGLLIGAVLEREDARDVLIAKNKTMINGLPKGALIAAGSLRRRAQLLNFRADFRMEGIRGNIETRLRKFKSEKFDAMVLAAAGLMRLNLSEYITEFISTDIIIPAVGQGAIAIEVKKTNLETRKIIKEINHSPTEISVIAERSFLRKLQGGCHVPIGAYGVIEQGNIFLMGMVGNPDGSVVLRESIRYDLNYPDAAGEKLAEIIIGKGGREILMMNQSPNALI